MEMLSAFTYIFELYGIVIPIGSQPSCPACSSPAFRKRYDDFISSHYDACGFCDICQRMSHGYYTFQDFQYENCPHGGDCPSTSLGNYDMTVFRTVHRESHYIVTIPDFVQDLVMSKMPDERVNTVILHNGSNTLNRRYCGTATFIIRCEIRNGRLRPGVLLYAKNAAFNYGPIQHPREHLNFGEYPFFI